MLQAFVKIDGGWRTGVVSQGVVLVSPSGRPVTREQAERAMRIPGDKIAVNVVSDNDNKPYEALVVTNAGPVPTKVRFMPRKEVSLKPGCLLGLLRLRHH